MPRACPVGYFTDFSKPAGTEALRQNSATLSLSTVLHFAHANEETNKNSHLITQEDSNFITQESFGSLGKLVRGKKGEIKEAYFGDREHAAEKAD